VTLRCFGHYNRSCYLLTCGKFTGYSFRHAKQNKKKTVTVARCIYCLQRACRTAFSCRNCLSNACFCMKTTRIRKSKTTSTCWIAQPTCIDRHCSALASGFRRPRSVLRPVPVHSDCLEQSGQRHTHAVLMPVARPFCQCPVSVRPDCLEQFTGLKSIDRQLLSIVSSLCLD